MARICSVDTCDYNVFGTDKFNGKGYCSRHQYLRTDKKKRIKHSTVMERNEKLARNKQDFDAFQWGFDSEIEMFRHIWAIKKHESEVSNLDLSDEKNFVSMFAHILCKNKYPLYRYNPNNICLVKPLEHVLIDAGTASARSNYTKGVPSANFKVFFDKKEELIKEYPK